MSGKWIHSEVALRTAPEGQGDGLADGQGV